ncbi:glycosyltransferase family 2 protein [Saccharomonospora halophila]|uniref:glycosyltransferase family 2 protein n=1 Tax=Saccharomonospora halophila TaxID=129922 RepID=UPI00035E3B14|nr:glycosyltransferase [Saccharomonospora halophila]
MRGSGDETRATLVCAVAVVCATAWTIVYHLTVGQARLSVTLVFYGVTTSVLIAFLLAAVRRRSFTHLPPADGTVIAIVPCFNTETRAVYRTVGSLLEQTRPPDEIYVIDDGSDEPLQGFEHDRVWWFSHRNAGKRHAQAAILEHLKHREFDFLLTVDDDAVLMPDAVEHTLRAMSDDRVQAATGLPVVRNRRDNWLTRTTDLEMVTWCLTVRSARSHVGAVAPCSGVLAVYRRDLVYDNLEDYVTSGTAGDDRRLTHYALERGQAVAVNEAVVETTMPDTVNGLWRQRVRWFKSYWRYLFWEIRFLRPVPLLFRVYSLIFFVLTPVILAWVVLVLPGTDKLAAVQGFGYWITLTYAQTAMYAAQRPELATRSRVVTWLLLTPVVSVVNLLVIKPAMYWAVTKARDESWQTRSAGAGRDEATRLVRAVPPPADRPDRTGASPTGSRTGPAGGVAHRARPTPHAAEHPAQPRTEQTRMLPSNGVLPRGRGNGR